MLINFKYYEIPNLSKFIGSKDQLKLAVIGRNITKEEHILLKKILQATGLHEDAISVFDLEDHPIHVKQLLDVETTRNILFFDIAPDDVGIQGQVKQYEPMRVHGSQLLFLDRLDVISQNTKLKKFIWETFKQWYADII